MTSSDSHPSPCTYSQKGLVQDRQSVNCKDDRQAAQYNGWRTPHHEKVVLVEAEGSPGSVKRSDSYPGTGRGLLAVFALLLALSLWATVFAGAAVAELARSGPIDQDTGFPSWFEDTEGLRLEPCSAGTNCSASGARGPSPTSGDAGGQLVYWSAAATMHTRDGGHASLVLSTRGGHLRSGGRYVFNRIQITADNLVPGATYTVTHPYGTETFKDVEGGDLGIDFTEDVGCLQTPCGGFATALNGRVGPWLTWDTLGEPVGGPPAGYIGDASTPHAVVGSPLTDKSGEQQNYFEIRGPDIGGPGVDRVRQDLFTVEGKIARLTAFASPRGGLYAGSKSVTLAASDPDAEIFYTTDGAEPTTHSTRYDGPISVADTTTLKFMAVGQAGSEGDQRRSPVFTETYTVGG